MAADFRGLLERLTRNEVEFLIVGGAAATVHGSTRLTRDLDIVYGRSPENIARLVRALRDLDPYLRGAPRGLPFRLDESTVRMGLNFTLVTTLGDLDLLGEVVGGGTYEELLPHVIDITAWGLRCKCVDLPTLIVLKRSAGRPRDLEALAELERILQERQREPEPPGG